MPFIFFQLLVGFTEALLFLLLNQLLETSFLTLFLAFFNLSLLLKGLILFLSLLDLFLQSFIILLSLFLGLMAACFGDLVWTKDLCRIKVILIKKIVFKQFTSLPSSLLFDNHFP